MDIAGLTAKTLHKMSQCIKTILFPRNSWQIASRGTGPSALPPENTDIRPVKKARPPVSAYINTRAPSSRNGGSKAPFMLFNTDAGRTRGFSRVRCCTFFEVFTVRTSAVRVGFDNARETAAAWIKDTVVVYGRKDS